MAKFRFYFEDEQSPPTSGEIVVDGVASLSDIEANDLGEYLADNGFSGLPSTFHVVSITEEGLSRSVTVS